MEAQHQSGESITRINNDLSLIEKEGSLPFGTDAYMLYAYIKKASGAVGVELGSGSGVVSLLAASSSKLSFVISVEIQEEMAKINERNIEYNSLSDKSRVICKDIREIKEADTGAVDVVFSNPPYMKMSSGKTSVQGARGIARHELNGGIGDFCAAASRVLKYGGLFYAVYRPERASDIMCAMRENGIEPKEMLFVHPDSLSEPSIMLIKGKKGAASGMYIAPPFYIYEDTEHIRETEDYKYVYEHGDFGERYRKHQRR